MGALIYRNCVRFANNDTCWTASSKKVIIIISVIVTDFVIPEEQEMENV
jgi:hypothetical protein